MIRREIEKEGNGEWAKPPVSSLFELSKPMRNTLLLLWIVSLFFVLPARGQDTADSLQQALQQAKTTEDKLKTLKQLYDYYERREPQRAERHARRALALSEQSPAARVDALSMLGVLYDNRGVYDTAIMLHEEAQQLAKKHDFPNILANTYHNIGLIEKNRSNYAEALQNYREALQIYQQKGNERGVATATANIALVYGLQGKHQTAINFYKKVLAVFRKIDNKRSVYWTLNRIGGMYSNLGDYALAIAYMDSSRVMAQELGDKMAVAWRLNNIAAVHQNWGNQEEALQYFNDALALAEGIENKHLVSVVLNNRADLWLEQGKYSEAKEGIQRARSISRDLGDKTGVAWANQLMGQLYMKQEQYTRALAKFKSALADNRALGNQLYATENYTEIGEAHLKLGNFDQAIQSSKKGLERAQTLGAKKHIRRAAQVLAKAHAEKRNYQQAYQYHVLFKQTNDSIFSEESQKKIRTIEARFDLERKENQIELQNTQLAQKDAELQEEKIRQRALWLGVLALLLIIGLTVIGYLRIRRARNKITAQNKIILEKNDHLSQQKAEIEQQSEQLMAANREISENNKTLKQQAEEIRMQADTLQAANEKLKELDRFKQDMTSMIAHDLKNPLNTVINTELKDKDSWQRSQQAGRQMLNLVSNMLDVHKYQETEMQTDPKDLKLAAVAEKALDDVRFLAGQKNIRLHQQIDEEWSVYADPELLTRIFTNLLTNAIKYTPLNGDIRLQAEAGKEQRKVMITDNGDGIPEALLPRIFSRFGQVEARKSGRIHSTGLGLTFCKMAVEAQGGEIGVDSQVGEGTRFWFTLPRGSAIQPETSPAVSAREDAYALSEADKDLLRPYAEELKGYTVYEVSRIMQVLERVDYPKDNAAIQAWIKEIDTCTFNLNETRYQEVLDL